MRSLSLIRPAGMVVMWLLLLVSAVSAEDDCFERLATDNPIGDSVTLVTKDNRSIKARYPTLNFRSSVVYVRLLDQADAADDLVIPFSDINRVIYRRASAYRHGVTILGMGVGISAGVLFYLGVTSEPRDWDEVGIGFFSGLVGGVLGAIAGHEVGKGLTCEVTLECP